MMTRLTATAGCEQKRLAPFLRSWSRDTRGSTAAEFAVLAFPFMFFLFGIIGLGFYFFTTTCLEFGVETAARQIRTGQAQKGGTTQAQFKQLVCNTAGTFIDCSSTKLKVHIQSAASWSGITPTPCLSNGGLTNSAGAGTDAISASSGAASQAVLVTVCYEWTLAQSLPYLMLGNMSNGSSLIQAATTFRTEPYQ